MGYEKEAYLCLSFHYTEKKDFQESTPKIQILMFGLAQTSHFGLWDIISPPPPPREHTKNPNSNVRARAVGYHPPPPLMFGLAQTSHFGLWDIISPPPPPPPREHTKNPNSNVRARAVGYHPPPPPPSPS